MYPIIRSLLKGSIEVYRDIRGLGFRVQVLNTWVVGIWVVVIIMQLLGKYMNIRYLDPKGNGH